jgi:GxxExxY protein
MSELYFPELSYTLVGICFNAQNKLGRFAREAQYGDFIENELVEKKIVYAREYPVPKMNDRVDFMVDNKIIVELKSKRYILKKDYLQIQRYLHALDIKLSLLVNFQNRHLKPLRIVKTDRPPGAPLPTIEIGD